MMNASAGVFASAVYGIWLRDITYGVDLMREVLVSASHFSPWIDCAILTGFSAVLVGIAIPLFRRE